MKEGIVRAYWFTLGAMVYDPTAFLFWAAAGLLLWLSYRSE